MLRSNRGQLGSYLFDLLSSWCLHALILGRRRRAGIYFSVHQPSVNPPPSSFAVKCLEPVLKILQNIAGYSSPIAILRIRIASARE
jgi:hypothetical protein